MMIVSKILLAESNGNKLSSGLMQLFQANWRQENLATLEIF
jgi:hypothetical protein